MRRSAFLLVPVLLALTASVAAAASSRVTAAVRQVSSVSLVGHGWGPGIGMGQWGDFGYATKFHFTYQRILAHYYGGTSAVSVASLNQVVNPTVSVVIIENLNLTTNLGYDPVITSTGGFSVTSATVAPPSTTTTSTSTTTTTVVAPSGPAVTGPVATGPGVTGPTTTGPTTTGPTTTGPTTTLPMTTPLTTPTGPTAAGGVLDVPAGSAVDLRLQPDGTWSAYVANSCTGARQAVTSSTPVATELVNPIATPAASGAEAPLLTLCRHDNVDEPVHGTIQAYDRSGYERTINYLPLQSYLDDVVPAEESASWGLDGGNLGAPQGEDWGFQALEAQAVAARSYTLASIAAGGWNGYADTCDTTLCEAYVGANYEYAVSDLAVADTAGVVLTSNATPSSIVSTQYSASTGGWTVASTFPAVIDRGDACVVPDNSLQCNPVHTWEASLTGASIAKAYPGLGTVERVRVTERNRRGAFGGRALEVVVTGSNKVLTVTGSSFASALGLRSDWFAVSHLTTAPATGQPAGPSGASGPLPSGPSGVSGAVAPSGPSGTVVPSGPTGASGPLGPSGLTGASGPTGASGV